MSAGGIRARYLAAADGLHSPIRTGLGLGMPAGRTRRWGIKRHIAIAPWSDYVEVYWSAHTEAYVTPVADDCVGIAILTSQQGRFEQHLDAFPRCGSASTVIRTSATGRRARCGRRYAAGWPDGCCWSAMRQATSTP